MSALIAKRYAKALLSAVQGAEEQGQIESQLKFLADACKIPAVQQFFENPRFQKDERFRLIKNLDLQPALLHCLKLLIDRNRISLLSELDASFRSELDRHLGRVRARVTSAKPLDAEQSAQIAQALSDRIGLPVLTENTVDPAVLAGIRAKIGGLVFDNTLQTQFSQLRKDLCS
ncbi:MAG: ATP synthase F1 subunit delta [Myxococcaceae bacterium]|nr:ATP synthase F1 subunit delta [Myxococcaceae bacterium]MBH2006162.1 ATP synthase F1 subunit delta [Myxococcaceae bacterium]